MKKEKKIILDLCGGTGAWSRPYKEAGYDVRNITLPDYDVRTYKPPENVYGILAAPPCTHLAGSGARWWKKKGKEALFEALAIVDACMRIILISKPKFWCLENPVGRLVHYLGKPKMYFNPCDFGDPWTKKTCLWGEFNIPKKNPVKLFIDPKDIPKGSHHQDMVYSKLLKQKKNPIWNMPPIKDRTELRSITPKGFAEAFFRANP